MVCTGHTDRVRADKTHARKFPRKFREYLIVKHVHLPHLSITYGRGGTALGILGLAFVFHFLFAHSAGHHDRLVHVCCEITADVLTNKD